MSMRLRKIIETRGRFANDESAIKLARLALRDALNKSQRIALDQNVHRNRCAIPYGDRFALAKG